MRSHEGTDIPILIDAIAAADKPCRVLDGKVMFALFAKPSGDRGFIWPEDDPTWSFAHRFDQSTFEARRKVTAETIEWQCGDGTWILMNSLRIPRVTASIDAAMVIAQKAFPNWWITCGICYLSGHASIGPDYNDPEAGERLRAQFPVDAFDAGFDADLEPGRAIFRTAIAILTALLQARLAALPNEESHGDPDT